MLPAPSPPSAAAASWRGDAAYGAMGLPLAFVALPLYVHLPPHMATHWGWSLAFTGLALVAVRLLDAFIDPALGRLSDRLLARSPRRLLAAAFLAAAVLVLAMAAVFGPAPALSTAQAAGAAADAAPAPWLARLHAALPPPQALALPLAALVLATVANSLLSIAHQAWGAALHRSDQGRSRAYAWREGAGLVGVLLASALPLLAGWGPTLALLAALLAAAGWAWSRTPLPPAAPAPPAAVAGPPPGATPAHRPWAQTAFRRLMAVFMLNGIAGAIPATLVVLFMTDRLGASAHWQAVLLTLYFAAGALGLPLWLKAVPRWGLARAWAAGMVGAALAFSAAATLGTGDVLGFAAVCLASGLMLGADLALPAALLARLIDHTPGAAAHRGLYFGWWSLATKLNLALAAGLALPLLALWGYAPGHTAEPALRALTLAYSGWPVLLKLAAAALLWRFFIRPLEAIPRP